MNKKLPLALAICLTLVLSVIFRSQIGNFISFGNDNQEGGQNIENSPSPTTTPMGSDVPAVSLTPRPGPSQMPIYKGRQEDELRPNPEDVKLFSESQKQDIYRALQNLGKTVKENPDIFSAWLQLGLLKKNIGDFEGARDAWEYAGLIRPQNSVSFANLGQLYWRYLRQFPQAETNFKISIKNEPTDAGTYVALSDLYFYSIKEKVALADDILLEGVKKNPESVDLEKALANLYERRSEYARAIEWWQKVLTHDPQNTSVAAAIDALRKKLGQ